MSDIKEVAKGLLVNCLDVRAEERVLVVTDDDKEEIGRAVYAAAKELGCDALLMQMRPRQVAGEEPPEAVAEAMRLSDVVICPTDKSLTHTDARIRAVRNGARIATMPHITKEMFQRGAMMADYGEVLTLTKKVAELLTGASTARIEKEDCVLSLDLRGRTGIISSGVYKNPGEGGNLPSGEAYIAPNEEKTCGEMIVDGSMVGIGKLNSPLRFRIKDGKAYEIQGESSEKLDVILQNERNATVCELGIGTNKSAILCGTILEDEKVYGTVHIAFGTNNSFGGTNKASCHMDGIILKPTLYLDDVLIIKDGEFFI